MVKVDSGILGGEMTIRNKRNRGIFRCAIFVRIVALVVSSATTLYSAFGAENTVTPTASDFVDVRMVDRTIAVDLRYAGTNNFMRQRFTPRTCLRLCDSALPSVWRWLNRF